jgi:hypothetical protein
LTAASPQNARFELLLNDCQLKYKISKICQPPYILSKIAILNFAGLLVKITIRNFFCRLPAKFKI